MDDTVHRHAPGRAPARRQLAAGVAAILVLMGCAFVLPRWLLFVGTMAASHGVYAAELHQVMHITGREKL